MKNTTPDPTEPIGKVTTVNDFLPSPEELVPCTSSQEPRTPGDWAGQVKMADDFDTTPEDVIQGFCCGSRRTEDCSTGKH